MNKGTLKRIQALEAKRAKRKAEPTAVDMSPWYATCATLFVGKPRKHESWLSAYARGARYKGGAAELYEVAMNDSDRFREKHVKATARPSPHRRADGKPMPPIVPDNAEAVRRKVLRLFVTEELTWQLLEFIDSTDATIGGLRVQKDGPVPLSPCRPMRPVAEPSV
jgi:hypothetical protein